MPTFTSVSPIPYTAYLILREIGAGHPVEVSYPMTRRGRPSKRRIAVQNGQRVAMRDVDMIESWEWAQGLHTLTPAGQEVVAAFGGTA